MMKLGVFASCSVQLKNNTVDNIRKSTSINQSLVQSIQTNNLYYGVLWWNNCQSSKSRMVKYSCIKYTKD